MKIDNLPPSVDSDQLRKAFKGYGNIMNSSVPTNRDGNNSGHGFVEFENMESALKAIKEMDRAKFNGQLVSVSKRF